MLPRGGPDLLTALVCSRSYARMLMGEGGIDASREVLIVRRTRLRGVPL